MSKAPELLFFRNPLTRPKIYLGNLDFYPSFCGKWLIHLKLHLEKSLYNGIKKIVRAVSLRRSLRYPKTNSPNHDFYKFSSSKTLIHSQGHLKEIYAGSLKRIVETVYEVLTPGPISGSSCPNFSFCFLTKSYRLICRPVSFYA